MQAHLQIYMQPYTHTHIHIRKTGEHLNTDVDRPRGKMM